MTEYIKRFTMDKDGVTIIDFVENEIFQCEYSDEAKSLCNVLNDLDYEKSNLKKENAQLKQQNKELKSDNDIKFWKHQFMMNLNTSQIILHELAKAIDNGYEYE